MNRHDKRHLSIAILAATGCILVATAAAALPQQQAAMTVSSSEATPNQFAAPTIVPTPDSLSPVRPDVAGIVPPLEISEAEARQWIAEAGYSQVSPLVLATTADGAPIYRGTAVSDGKVYAVIVDSWGSIAGWR